MSNNGSLLRKVDATGVPLLITRFVLGGWFIYLGNLKLSDPIEFLKQVRLYHMLPESPPYFLNGTAIVLPWLEVICGVLLIIGFFMRGAAVHLMVMLAVFIPALLMRGLQISAETGISFFQVAFDCGCGTGVVVTWKKLVENGVLFLLAAYVLFSGSRRFSLTMLLERRKPFPAYCHLCGYRVKGATTGLCDACSSPPELPRTAAEPA